MHELMDYICGELEELERKAKEGKLSMAEIQYGDTLAHFKKNLLKSEEMWDDSEYSGRDSYRRSNRAYGRSYARRDSRGRYTSRYYGDEMVSELRSMMDEAPDDRTRQEFQKFISRIEQM